MRMSESDEGVSLALMRQKGGVVVNVLAAFALGGVGGVNAPA
jgi:hypothetical protein